jgi:hypothetical protein
MSNTALKWQDHGSTTMGYRWYTALAARGFYFINPTFTGRASSTKRASSATTLKGDELNRSICGVVGRGGVMEVAEAKAAAQADHDAGRDR